MSEEAWGCSPTVRRGICRLFELHAEFTCLQCERQFTGLLRRVAIPINERIFCRNLRSFAAKGRAQGCEQTLEGEPESELYYSRRSQPKDSAADADSVGDPSV